MMILNFDFSMLVVFDRRYALSEFRRASKVIPNSYADEFVERMYNCFFEYPRDVYDEYIKYYAMEYSDFGKFLYWKYKLSRDTVQKITNKMVGREIYIGYGKDSFWMFGDEKVISMLNHVFSDLGERVNEDTD